SAGMPPAGPFLFPARKGRKNRPGKSRPVDGEIFSSFAKLCFGNDNLKQGKIPNLSPLPGPSSLSNGQKGSSPFWKTPRYRPRWRKERNVIPACVLRTVSVNCELIDVCPYGVLLFPFACSPFPFVLISLNGKRFKVF
ncbi:MAG: hypothetical protein IKH07_02830, partial [Oscillospiraceae bacterium]|nr:hypothetical protein [Oscillospiraceae bacterium]